MTTKSKPVPAISERETVGRELQSLLVELLDLGLEAKQAHWNVVGPFFKPLHEQYDSIAADAREWSDLIAERLTAIDVAPDGRVSTLARDTPLPKFPAGEIAGHDSVELMTATIGSMVDRTRERVERLAEPDAASQDLVIEVLQGLEKHLWMLRVQLDSR